MFAFLLGSQESQWGTSSLPLPATVCQPLLFSEVVCRADLTYCHHSKTDSPVLEPLWLAESQTWLIQTVPCSMGGDTPQPGRTPLLITSWRATVVSKKETSVSQLLVISNDLICFIHKLYLDPWLAITIMVNQK